MGFLKVLLAVPLFTLVSVPVGIALCASVMVGIGTAGFARFGFSDPAIEPTRKEQEKVHVIKGP